MALVDTLGPYRIELYEARANPKQLAIQEDFFAKRHRTYAALGGNRSGKTVCIGGMCFAKWIRDVARDGDLFWVISPTSEKSVTGPQKFLWNTLPHWMFGKFHFDEKNGFDGQRPIVTIVLPNDRGRCVINFKNCEQSASTFESDSVNGAWASERLPYEYYQRLIPRTIDKAGWILIDDIPEQSWHWFELMKAPPAAKVLATVLSMYDNEQNLPAGEIPLAAARMSQEEQAMRIWGKFRSLSGVVYKEFDQEIHVVPAFGIPSIGPYPSETNWPRWRGLDVGGSAPTACLWFAIAPNETVYVYREYYQTFGNVKSHAHAIKEMSIDHKGKREEYIGNLIDPAAWQITASNDVTVADQYALEGLDFSPWPQVNVMGEHAMVEIVKRKLEVGQYKVMKHCANHIREFGAWKYKTDSEGNPLASDTYENKNNHSLDVCKGFLGTRPVFSVPQIRVAR